MKGRLNIGSENMEKEAYSKLVFKLKSQAKKKKRRVPQRKFGA